MQKPQGIPSFESGKVLLSTGDVEVLAVNLTSTHIDVNIEDKAFVKRIIAMRNQFVPEAPSAEEETKLPSPGGALSMVRSVAETLCKRGITITVSYRGKRIATIGANADPKLLHYITKTKGVALNSLYTALKMMI